MMTVLTGCAGPAQRIDSRAAEFGFARSVQTGIEYAHVTYRNQGDGTALHVYIENDGEPWAGRYSISSDPTPSRPVMLDLMALDGAPAVYLGRPCYLGLSNVPPCEPLAWTHERYSKRVVDSMAASLRQIMSMGLPKTLVFFGHSGGGTLAVLLAEGFPETVAVVTLAGNLDIEAWARLHHYTPLRGSLNPLEQQPLAPGIIQKHYVGSLDGNVTPLMLRRYAQRHRRAVVIELQGFDHDCCWRKTWETVLQDLGMDLTR